MLGGPSVAGGTSDGEGGPVLGLIANVVISKCLDRLPLYHQSSILARKGVEIKQATVADWVAMFAQLIGAHVMAAPVIKPTIPVRRLNRVRSPRLWSNPA